MFATATSKLEDCLGCSTSRLLPFLFPRAPARGLLQLHLGRPRVVMPSTMSTLPPDIAGCASECVYMSPALHSTFRVPVQICPRPPDCWRRSCSGQGLSPARGAFLSIPVIR